jgi:hypothetical protein
MADDKPDKADDAPDLDAMRKEIETLKTRTQVYEQTLKALQPAGGRESSPDQSPSYSYRPSALPSDARQRLKQALGQGWTDQDLDTHWSIIGSFLTELGQPLVNAIGTLADSQDYVRTRLTKSDYAEIEDDVEQEYKQRLRRGNPASRAELYEVVKARKMPELVERKVQAKLDEEKTRSAQAKAAETEGAVSGGQAKPGDNPFKSGRDLSVDEFGKLSLEDKEKYLEGKTF